VRKKEKKVTDMKQKKPINYFAKKILSEETTHNSTCYTKDNVLPSVSDVELNSTLESYYIMLVIKFLHSYAVGILKHIYAGYFLGARNNVFC
jgi:hypothetical protein